MFSPGDRVRVVATPRGLENHYLHGTGTVVAEKEKVVLVLPDPETSRKAGLPYEPDDPWHYGKSAYTLELIDNSAMYTPEDWS